MHSEGGVRMYTFLFTDLEGSTQLWQQQPEAMKIALARHDALLRSAVESCNGQVVKTTGDGLHAVFASSLDSLNALPDATYGLEISLANVTRGAVSAKVGLGQLPVGAFASAEGAQMLGRITDAETGAGIPGGRG